jgi:hypothetical protein
MRHQFAESLTNLGRCYSTLDNLSKVNGELSLDSSEFRLEDIGVLNGLCVQAVIVPLGSCITQCYYGVPAGLLVKVA